MALLVWRERVGGPGTATQGLLSPQLSSFWASLPILQDSFLFVSEATVPFSRVLSFQCQQLALVTDISTPHVTSPKILAKADCYYINRSCVKQGGFEPKGG